MAQGPEECREEVEGAGRLQRYLEKGQEGEEGEAEGEQRRQLGQTRS